MYVLVCGVIYRMTDILKLGYLLGYYIQGS